MLDALAVDLVYVEPHPEIPDLDGAFEPEVFIGMLEESPPA